MIPFSIAIKLEEFTDVHLLNETRESGVVASRHHLATRCFGRVHHGSSQTGSVGLHVLRMAVCLDFGHHHVIDEAHTKFQRCGTHAQATGAVPILSSVGGTVVRGIVSAYAQYSHTKTCHT